MSYSNRIGNAIDKYGELVDIENYQSESYSDYGDLYMQSTTDMTSVKAIFNTYGKRAGFQTEGIYEAGDVTFFFKADQTGLVTDNVVVRSNGERWKIKGISTHYIKGDKTHTECSVINI